MLKWFNGKKLYLTAIATFILGGLQAINFPIPEYAWTLLGAFGLVAGRSAIKKLEK
jgi:hypothetical protein